MGGAGMRSFANPAREVQYDFVGLRLGSFSRCRCPQVRWFRFNRSADIRVRVFGRFSRKPIFNDTRRTLQRCRQPHVLSVSLLRIPAHRGIGFGNVRELCDLAERLIPAMLSEVLFKFSAGLVDPGPREFRLREQFVEFR